MRGGPASSFLEARWPSGGSSGRDRVNFPTMARLSTLFVLVPLLELILLIRLGEWIGFLPTVLLVVGTGILGAFLIRREGLRALLAIQLELARGRLPTRVLLDGAAVLVAGAFLMTPGVLTDLAGFFLLLPPTRTLVAGWVQTRLAVAVARGTVRFATWGFSATGGVATHRPGGAGQREGSPRSDAGSPVGLGRPGVPLEEEAGPRPPRPGEIIQD